MASNLKSAKQAIEAELSHTRQGLAYYAARVEALESALHQLESVDGSANASSNEANAKNLKENEGKRGRKARGEAKELPKTGGDFWLELVSDEPKSAVDISNAAIAALGINPGQKEHIQKLKQRVSPALAGLVSAHKIKDSGAGRERRFFKTDNQQA
jgi:chromosome segregation ATPase